MSRPLLFRAVARTLVGPALIALTLAACPTPKPRFVPKNGDAGLPDDPKALIALADQLTAKEPATLENLDRAQAALTKAEQKAPSFISRWRLARACFLMTALLKNKQQLVEVARAGMAHGETAAKLEPQRVEGHYYLALNMARVAEAKWKITYVKPMVAAGERARKLDATYDHAGPLVFLGKVYLTAPAWPVSVGNTEKAVKLLEEAVKIAPRPLNRLFLGQAYLEEEEEAKAKEQLTLALQGKLEDRWRREAQAALKRIKN